MRITFCALAASIIFTPAIAQENKNDCSETQPSVFADHRPVSGVMHLDPVSGLELGQPLTLGEVYRQARVLEHKFCLGFERDDHFAKGIEPSKDKPACINIDGGDDPIIVKFILVDGQKNSLQVTVNEANTEFWAIVKECTGRIIPPSEPIKFVPEIKIIAHERA